MTETICDHPGFEHGQLGAHLGVCPRCGVCKYVGHGPLCPECYLAPAKSEELGAYLCSLYSFPINRDQWDDIAENALLWLSPAPAASVEPDGEATR